MPVNRNALIRYKTIDNCLRNRYRKWKLEDLIDACSDALYEFEGIDKGVSRRTVQMDIQIMRSEKLGYNAPIVVTDKKYYTYSDPDYSITNIPLTDQDLNKLTEVVDILKQFKGFTHFEELNGMIQKLEDKVHVSKTHERSIINLEKNEHLKGLEYIDPIYQSILNKKALELTYQSFKARAENTFLFHPALLKEYRNRWFVLGKKKEKLPFLMLALDRINALEPSEVPVIDYDEDTINNYFNDVIGVSVGDGQRPEEIKLLVYHSNVPYVLTKPMHHSQRVLEKNDQGVVISLKVQINFELEREILGFGDRIKVLSPSRLRNRIRDIFMHSIDLYDTELNTKSLPNIVKSLQNGGFSIINQIYTRKEINIAGSLIQKHYTSESDPEPMVTEQLFSKIPELEMLLLNNNLRSILQFINPDLSIRSATFTKYRSANPDHWHQTVSHTDALIVHIHLDDTDKDKGCMKVFPGSHKKILSEDELKLITGSSIPIDCEVLSGGIHLFHPAILRRIPNSESKKKCRVIRMVFGTNT